MEQWVVFLPWLLDLCSSSLCSCSMKIKHKLEQLRTEALTHVSNDRVLILAFPKLCSHKGLPCLNVRLRFSSYYKIRLLSNRQREADRFTLQWEADVSKLNKKSKKRSSFVSSWHQIASDIKTVMTRRKSVVYCFYLWVEGNIHAGTVQT